jgi:hypothetical protein
MLAPRAAFMNTGFGIKSAAMPLLACTSRRCGSILGRRVASPSLSTSGAETHWRLTLVALTRAGPAVAEDANAALVANRSRRDRQLNCVNPASTVGAVRPLRSDQVVRRRPAPPTGASGVLRTSGTRPRIEQHRRRRRSGLVPA